MSFLDIAVSREDKTFTTSVNRKPTFSGVYAHFDSFWPSTYKFGTVYTLAYRCFRICSSWTKLHNELVCLKETFLKNGYPEDFINKCFKKFMDNVHVVKETTLTVEKNPLVRVLVYLGSLSFWFLLNFLFILALFDILASLSISRVFSSVFSGRLKFSCLYVPRTITKCNYIN